MKPIVITIFVFVGIFNMALFATTAWAGNLHDHFVGTSLNEMWKGDRNHFSIENGNLVGISAHPVGTFLRFIYIGNGWTDYTVRCRVNVVQPNLLICTKGALLIRYQKEEGIVPLRKGGQGVVFALHVASQKVEVYRLSGEYLLSVQTPLELKKWYELYAEVKGNQFRFYLDGKEIGNLIDAKSSFGAVGVAVEDAMRVLCDDFSVTGPDVPDIGTSINARGKMAILWGRLKAQ
ncbi:hypothetical protein FJZ31_08415 [Candidatus Poribacteria bacterium]|nr:hypothetical protein [Candidatus Poribacteria bacterium]